MESITIEYEATQEGVIAFNEYHLDHSASMQSLQRKCRRMVPLLYTIMGLLTVPLLDTWIPFFVMLTISLIWYVRYPSYWRRTIRQRAQKMLREGHNPGMGACRMEISTDGLHVVGPVSDVRMKWKGVTQIAESDLYVYLYISATSTYVVPKTAFRTLVESERFVEIARQYREIDAGLRKEISPDFT